MGPAVGRVTRARVITPITFWASFLPCWKAIMEADSSWRAENTRLPSTTNQAP